MSGLVPSQAAHTPVCEGLRKTPGLIHDLFGADGVCPVAAYLRTDNANPWRPKTWVCYGPL
jgi:hypothetical protein